MSEIAPRKQKRSAIAPAPIRADVMPDTDISRRKSEHVDIIMREDVNGHRVTTGLEHIRFENCALPELDLDAIDLSTSFVGRRMKAPLIVNSMTGGPLHARRINHAIAEAAGRCGIGFAVGSQRIALEGKGNAGLSRELRSLAGPVPILANFGAAQLKEWHGPDMAERALDMIDADGLIIHLNPLQEAVQPGGDRQWTGLLTRIEQVARHSSRPIIVKEVGAGITGPVARQLWNAGVRIIDAAGAGGTSWAAVESRRARDARSRIIAEAFRDWGTPTAHAVMSVRRACPEAVIIASGGLRDGIDAAKAIRIGADIVGQAAIALPAALAGPEALVDHLAIIIEQLRIACFCTGSGSLAALRHAPLVGGAVPGDPA